MLFQVEKFDQWKCLLPIHFHLTKFSWIPSNHNLPHAQSVYRCFKYGIIFPIWNVIRWPNIILVESTVMWTDMRLETEAVWALREFTLSLCGTRLPGGRSVQVALEEQLSSSHCALLLQLLSQKCHYQQVHISEVRFEGASPLLFFNSACVKWESFSAWRMFHWRSYPLCTMSWQRTDTKFSLF